MSEEKLHWYLVKLHYCSSDPSAKDYQNVGRGHTELIVQAPAMALAIEQAQDLLIERGRFVPEPYSVSMVANQDINPFRIDKPEERK